MTTTTLFSQVDAPGITPGFRWVCELVDADTFESCTVPCAVAWVRDFGVCQFPPFPAILDFVMVPDHLRRKGHATTLIRACEARWPGLVLTDAIGPEGEGLLESLEAVS